MYMRNNKFRIKLVKGNDIEEGDVIISDELTRLIDSRKGRKHLVSTYLSERNRRVVGVRKELGNNNLVLHYFYTENNNTIGKKLYPDDIEYKSSFIVGKDELLPIIYSVRDILINL